jgi:hypothetical protein
VRLRVAEIDQHTVAHVLRDKAVEPGDDLGDGPVIGGDDLAQILRIEPRRELGRADQVAEHHGELPAFGGHHSRGWLRRSSGIAPQCGDRGEQFAAVPDKAHAEVLEVLGGQLRQYRGIDRVVAKRLLVLPQSEAVEPGRDVHARLPAAVIAALI